MQKVPKCIVVVLALINLLSSVIMTGALIDLGQSEGGSDLYGHGGQSNCSPLPDQEHTPNPDHTDALKSATPPPPGTFEYI